MKHARPDYGRIQDPAGLIPDDEPVFLLRAQDTCAPATLMVWVALARSRGVAAHMIEAAERQVEAMAKWQMLHGEKLPDMPAQREE